MSTAMVDSFRTQQLPHRKPVPTQVGGGPSQTMQAHSRTPSAASSTTYPTVQTGYPQGPYSDPSGQRGLTTYIQPARRTLSNATASTASTSGSGSNKGAPTGMAPGLQRTASNRSGASFAAPNSYVALMRKQKATVWCDRAQLEDPRLVAQRRAAKQRAAAEMAGSVQSVRLLSTSTGMRQKIRHHGVPKASIYQPGNLSGSAVPMRLSASEVDEGDSEDAETGSQNAGGNGKSTHHQRTGSGRSSVGSGRRVMYNAPGQGRLSNSGTPTSAHANSPSTESARSETIGGSPVSIDNAGRSNDYASASKGTGLSSGSMSSGEREHNFGGLGQIPQTRFSLDEDSTKGTDELRRRGSVDDRTMTMSGVRLYVANPDLSD